MTSAIRGNERSEAIRIISHINAYLRDKSWRISGAGGENTVTAGAKHMFPDVILYADKAQTKVLQGWEIKMPDVPITDAEFIGDAQRKAVTLGLNSCFIWNFTSGVLYKRNPDNTFCIVKQWNNTSHIRTRKDVDVYRADWTSAIELILERINEYFFDGEFRSANIGEIVPDSVQSEIILRNKSILAECLKASNLTDTRIAAGITLWWEQVRSEYITDETDAYAAYARIILLNWTNRILFAHFIKANHNVARAVDDLNYQSTPEQANETFMRISDKCDYYSIFVPIDYNTILPDDTWRDLMELNAFLAGSTMADFSQSSLQAVLERTVSSAKRELTGQFTTPQRLAEILTAVTMRDLTGDCIDPCCATGTISYAALANKISHGVGRADAYKTTWASDKFSFPLQIASISLARFNAVDQPLRVFRCDALLLHFLDEVPIVNPSFGGVEHVPFPRFASVVSNLPFVPSEMADNDARGKFNLISDAVLKDTGLEMNFHSDLYQYLVLSLWKVLKDNGRAGFITSNSWLGTRAGRRFYECMGYYYDIEQVHISGKGRWFHNADVVAVMLILTKKSVPAKPEPTDKTLFYVWKKSLWEMGADDVRSLSADAALGVCGHSGLISMTAYSASQIAGLSQMNISLNALFSDVHWLVGIARKLCPVTKYLNVVRGERRGWDRMFYPAKGHGVESKYIRKVLKNARRLSGLYAVADSDAFCCGESVAALERNNDKGALNWIRSFEHEYNEVGKPLPSVLARPNMYWYEMRDANKAEFVMGMNPDKRLFFAMLDEPSFVNQRLIALNRKNGDMDKGIIHALLNSILGMFYIEAIGFGRGLGALDISASNIGNMRMLDPALIDGRDKERILSKFSVLCARNVSSVSEELEREDRAAFDRAVLSAFGIERYYDEIKATLISMQRIRRAVKE